MRCSTPSAHWPDGRPGTRPPPQLLFPHALAGALPVEMMVISSEVACVCQTSISVDGFTVFTNRCGPSAIPPQRLTRETGFIPEVLGNDSGDTKSHGLMESRVVSFLEHAIFLPGRLPAGTYRRRRAPSRTVSRAHVAHASSCPARFLCFDGQRR